MNIIEIITESEVQNVENFQELETKRNETIIEIVTEDEQKNTKFNTDIHEALNTLKTSFATLID